MQNWVAGHRGCYKQNLITLRKKNTVEEIDMTNDLWMLGQHLHQGHGLVGSDAFDKFMQFGILEVVNSTELEREE